MADSAVLDPPPPYFSAPFDPVYPPDNSPPDLPHHPDLFSDLYFDGDLEFSIDDLIDFPESDDSPRIGSDAKDGSGVSSSSPGRGTHSSGANSDGYVAFSPDTGNSAMAAGDREEMKPEAREERMGWLLKRKKERGDVNGNPNSDANADLRSCKFRRSGVADEADSSCLFNAGSEEEEKRKARLMRNRESAQLSRQRKKHYVEELEEKVRSMHSMISDLNSKITFVMAENARLRQQLGSNGGKSPTPGVYLAMPPTAPVPFPWIPCSGYTVRPPGVQVPLVPIPRLKSQQGMASAKPKKSEVKKGESKMKKVASVSLLGLLFFMLVVGGFDFGYRSLSSDGLISYGKSGMPRQSRGRVLTVTGDFDKLNETVKHGPFSENHGGRKVNGDQVQNKRLEREDEGNEARLKSRRSHAVPENASEPLLASLYIPRNEKLVKIDGNLIISSVLASEKAMARTSSKDKGYKTDQTLVKGHKETDLEVKDIVLKRVSSALAVGNSGREGGRHTGAYVKPARNQKALPSGSGDIYINNLKSTSADRHLQDWFHEGLEGPIFSSGMCTEVFQFDASQDSGNTGGAMIPATSIANATINLTESSPCPTKLKNRRILYPEPMSLSGSTLNDTGGGNFSRPQQDRGPKDTTMGKSMVVSVLIDPREVGDGSDIDGMMSPKTASRIFVVVLVDGVKYVTYSCMLPFKSNTQPLVTA